MVENIDSLICFNELVLKPIVAKRIVAITISQKSLIGSCAAQVLEPHQSFNR